MKAQEAKTRYRHVQGGLDNAVKQAEEKNLHDLFIVDVDCHQAEPFVFFSKYLPDRWKKQYSDDKLLALSKSYDEDYERYYRKHIPDREWAKALMRIRHDIYDRYSDVDRLMDGRIRRPEMRQAHAMGQLPEEVVEIFAQRIHDIGIKRCILFPNTILDLGSHPDLELEVALSNAYIDYMLDNFLGKYPEILSFVNVPVNSPDKATELIDRVGSEKGVVGVMACPTSQIAPFAGDDSWNPIYEAAQQRGLPICFHGSAGSYPPLNRFKEYLPMHALGFVWFLVLQLASIVVEGVPERFPKLKFVFMEGGVTWIPWLMQRLDSEYLMRSSEAPLLTKKPSEYIKEFYFSSQPLEHPSNSRDLEWVFRAFNAETQLMYASDYPHWDFDVPSVIYDLPFLSLEAKKKILGENARQLFKIN